MDKCQACDQTDLSSGANQPADVLRHLSLSKEGKLTTCHAQARSRRRFFFYSSRPAVKDMSNMRLNIFAVKQSTQIEHVRASGAAGGLCDVINFRNSLILFYSPNVGMTGAQR
jgi:hypothetical protein